MDNLLYITCKKASYCVTMLLSSSSTTFHFMGILFSDVSRVRQGFILYVFFPLLVQFQDLLNGVLSLV